MVPWIALNVLLALLPLLAIYRSYPKGGRGFGLVFGDGILFFYTLVLGVGLGVDFAKDLLLPEPRIPEDLVVTFWVFLPIFAILTWSAYSGALSERNSGSEDGAAFGLASLLSSVASLAIVIYIRNRYGLW